MKQTIDCLIIGQNQLPFETYEKIVREMGEASGAYQDLDKNTIRYRNKLCSGADIFNTFCAGKTGDSGVIHAIKPVETFNAAIAYLGTFLRRRGFTFDYINGFREEKEKLAQKLEQEQILTIAITTTFYVAAFPLLEIMKFIKQHNTQARVIVGGPFISTKVRSLAPRDLGYLFETLGADFYVNSSQGETALVNIIHALKNNLPLDHIKNIHVKTGKNYAATALERENNVLADNMVDWSLFGTEAGEFINLRTGISCPFSCSFCGFPEHAGQYQTAPVEAVEKELNQLSRIPTVKNITFVDDTFNIPPKRFKDILRRMIKNNYQFRWNSFYRCQYADREAMELMKASGVESVFLGLESGNEQILKNMNKEADLDQFRRGLDLLHQFDITTFGNFIIGFPGETDESAQDTMNFIKTSGLDFYRAQLWYCEPITPIWREREKYELSGESFEWNHKTMNSTRACEIIKDLLLTQHQSTRLIQYYFDYDNVMQLTHKGMSLTQVKKFLKAFDNGVKEKLSNPGKKEVSFEVIKQIKDSCRVEVPGASRRAFVDDSMGTRKRPPRDLDF
jgi:anaerobic magnesium-protoporphyrin IX monomethyl ester cyclase